MFLGSLPIIATSYVYIHTCICIHVCIYTNTDFGKNDVASSFGMIQILLMYIHIHISVDVYIPIQPITDRMAKNILRLFLKLFQRTRIMHMGFTISTR